MKKNKEKTIEESRKQDTKERAIELKERIKLIEKK